MPDQSAPLRLLAVHAHPDDESSKGAATMAKYVAQGVQVLVVSCTGGERGDVLNPTLKDDPQVLADLPAVRRAEMAMAQEILGVEHVWLGFEDSGLPEGDPMPPLPEGCFALQPVEVPAAALTRVIRDFKPHVMTTYDEAGGYPHPDHIMCHTVSMAAFEAAGTDRFPEAGAPWQPLKLYYNQTISKARITAFHEALLAMDGHSPYTDWIARLADRTDRTVTTRIECSEYFPVRDRALLAHATQVDPDGTWFSVPLEVQNRVWPTEDFELAVSYVPYAPGHVESDLFENLPPDPDAACRAPGGIAYDGRVDA